jgi:hypothetical protein
MSLRCCGTGEKSDTPPRRKDPLYGVDLIKTQKGFSLIEVDCFPCYKGVPQGRERISQFILENIE